MTITLLPLLLTVGSGAIIGVVLGLVGGGGSIVAVPLLVYIVGVAAPHVAIGTAAVAVALNAAIGLIAHVRHGTVKWRCAGVFAGAGIVGSALGAEAGKAIDGQHLLALFGLLMIGVALSMVRGTSRTGNADVRLSWKTAPQLLHWLVGIGLAVGLLSGFFGIGGGFLIVPGLMLATGMPMANAIGTSLVAVTAFGLTTSVSYAASGLVDLQMAALLLAGGAVGSLAGSRLSQRLAQKAGLLTQVFAGIVFLVGAAILIGGAAAFAA